MAVGEEIERTIEMDKYNFLGSLGRWRMKVIFNKSTLGAALYRIKRWNCNYSTAAANFAASSSVSSKLVYYIDTRWIEQTKEIRVK